MIKIPLDMKAGAIHPTNLCGDIEVIEYTSANNVLVKFSNTGTITKTHSSMIRKGNTKDRNVPQVYGIGFVGEGDYITSINNKPVPNYTCWLRIIRRCYDKKNLSRSSAYIDCSVCKEWHNFQNFAKWYKENYPKDGLSYELDKDIKIKGNKIYSPSSCLFVTKQENVEMARSKSFSFKSPDGVVFNIYNLRMFSLSNGLIPSKMSQVHSKNRKSHKGWTKA